MNSATPGPDMASRLMPEWILVLGTKYVCRAQYWAMQYLDVYSRKVMANSVLHWR